MDKLNNCGFEIEEGYVSKAETPVYKLLIQGASKKEIARILHKSVKTIEKQIASIYEKLDVHCAAAAVHVGYLKRIIKLLSLTLILNSPLVYNSFEYLSDENRDLDIRRQRISRTIRVKDGTA